MEETGRLAPNRWRSTKKKNYPRVWHLLRWTFSVSFLFALIMGAMGWWTWGIEEGIKLSVVGLLFGSIAGFSSGILDYTPANRRFTIGGRYHSGGGADDSGGCDGNVCH